MNASLEAERQALALVTQQRNTARDEATNLAAENIRLERFIASLQQDLEQANHRAKTQQAIADARARIILQHNSKGAS